MILILGVTASGKGALAFGLARALGGQILSVDSMKVYRRMDVGTAKPSADRQRQIRYHLIDVVEPSESFSVEQFLHLSAQAVGQIRAAGQTVIAVGGTAMYIKALLYGLFQGPGADAALRRRLKEQAAQEGSAGLHATLAAVDPQAAQRIHPHDTRRIVRALEVFELTGRPISALQEQWTGRADPQWTILGLRRDKAAQSRRINERVKRMIDQGLVQEVRSLLDERPPLSTQARAAIGYAEIIRHIQGDITLDEAIEQIKINTRRLAKAQRTWFKTFRSVRWIDIPPDTTPEQLTEQALQILGDRPAD